MQRLWISLLALSLAPLLCAAPTGAQQTSTMTITDATLDASPPPANAYADIEAGSIALLDAATLRLSLQLASLPPEQPGLGYGIVFSDGAGLWYGAAVTIPELKFLYGRWDGDSPSSNDETSGSFTTGLHGMIEVDFPVKALGNATRLSAPQALVVDVKGDFLPVGAGFLVLDEAAGEGELVLRDAAPQETPPADTPPADDAAPAAVAEPAPEAGAEARVPLPGALLAAGALAAAGWGRGRSAREK